MKRNIFSILTVVAAFFAATSCGKDSETAVSGLTISVDTPVIRADGQSAAKIIVKFGNSPVTSGVSFYDARTNKPIEIPDFKFTTQTAGTYSFWAAYQTFQTSTLDITAVDSPLPELPSDTQPTKTVFKKRTFIIQFTGTDCQYCPYMIDILEQLEKSHPEQFVLAACHTYNLGDPAYLGYNIDNALAVGGYPTVVLNMDKSQKFSNYQYPSMLTDMLEDDYGDGSCGIGISVASTVDGENLIIKAQMKVADSGRYRIGAWLLEDGIVGKQQGSPNETDIHDNCVRDIYSKNSSTDYSGSLHIMEAGKTANQFFIGKLKSNWQVENLHIVVFVCTQNEAGNYFVSNVIDCPAGGSLTYDY
ncbi:MAG: Omp28-related outer membrane protein [Candidatus Cryptobacteroides sp.]